MTLLDSLVVDLERLIAALAPAEVVGGTPTDIRDLAYDARAVAPGALFFCVPGMRADGHDFAPEAVANGAVALVVERPLDLAVPQLVVADARRAMAAAADEFYGRPTEELQVAGVTGTSGKTTTAFLLYAVLAAAGRRPGLLGTIETRVDGERRPATRTTAEAIDLQRLFREMLDAGDGSCAMEATSHGSALGRLDGVRFASLIFTNLSQDHLDFHPTMEDYFDAKRRLFLGGDAPPAAVNVGDEYGRRLAEDLRAAGTPLLTFGLDGRRRHRGDPPRARRHTPASPPPGSRSAPASAAASTSRTCWAWSPPLGCSSCRTTRSQPGSPRVAGVPGRFESIDEGQPFTVVVDYAHKPGALENVLRAARELATGRVICVFGAGATAIRRSVR